MVLKLFSPWLCHVSSHLQRGLAWLCCCGYVLVALLGMGGSVWAQSSNTLGALQLKTGVVENNLFVSLAQAGVPDEVALTMVQELSQMVNLQQSIDSGSRFALLYENKGLLERGKARLLSFEFTTGAVVHQAYWFGSSDQQGYYQADGSSLRPAYLRTPIEILRVSSNFGVRKHPIHKAWRMHEGTDFAAPVGTRVFAAGDGEVSFIGVQNGFGKVIKLKHPLNTTTVYAHLVAFTPALQLGQSVKQGEVIGFVGKTGWATGPHLHYEYRVDNRPIDPFSADVPLKHRVAEPDMVAFAEWIKQLQAHFGLLRAPPKAAVAAQ